ncbi:MAG: cupin [Rhizobium sp.]|nr:cupin [Rhizobium sp.]
MTTPNWHDYTSIEMDDLGISPATISGEPRVSLKILNARADGTGECGIWSCTPGERTIVFDHDEFCHFLGGEGVYIHDNGEEIPVTAGSIVFFPNGWSGRSIITKTLSKAYAGR